MNRHAHWEQVYATKAETEVSWYQPHAATSLRLIQAAAPDRGAAIIDIGAGASTLVDDLLAKGYRNLALLDISETALSRSKARLHEQAANLTWIAADITEWSPPRTWDLWHDRAVFHFLVEREQQDAYIAALTAATKPGASIILSTFALDGPEKCSRLPVQRYSPDSLATRLGSAFTLTDQLQEAHKTPWGSEQRFSYAVLKRRATG